MRSFISMIGATPVSLIGAMPGRMMGGTLAGIFAGMPRGRLLLAGLLIAGLPIGAGGGAGAQDDGACLVAAHLVHPDFALPHVAAALHHKQLDVVVIGSASSALAGPAGAGKAYPARLQAALAKRLPDVAVTVTTYARPRESAAEMERSLRNLIPHDKPTLVIWQTGTADAIRGIDLDAFRSALGDGANELVAAGIDLIFMNMQYSPRTESMIALGAYADALRFVALQHEVILFDRAAIMKYWNEIGTFDLSAATKKSDIAEQVHNCIGRLLADLIVESAKLTVSDDKDIH